MEQSESGNQKADHEEMRMHVRPFSPLLVYLSRMHSAVLHSCGIADAQIDNTQHVYMDWSWDMVYY